MDATNDFLPRLLLFSLGTLLAVFLLLLSSQYIANAEQRVADSGLSGEYMRVMYNVEDSYRIRGLEVGDAEGMAQFHEDGKEISNENLEKYTDLIFIPYEDGQPDSGI